MLAAGVTAVQAESFDTPVYGGIGISATSLDDADGRFNDLIGMDDSEEAISLFIGYKFNENFAVEGGWSDLGDYAYDGGDMEVEAITFDAVGILAIDDQVSLFAKVGAARIDYKADLKSTETALTFGLGADYNFGNNLSLQAEWTRINEATAPIDTYGANIAFGF